MDIILPDNLIPREMLPKVNEVDFIWQKNINEPYPVEVKFKFDSKQPVPPGMKSFLRLYPSEKAFIVHLGDFHTRKFENTTCYAIPPLGPFNLHLVMISMISG